MNHPMSEPTPTPNHPRQPTTGPGRRQADPRPAKAPRTDGALRPRLIAWLALVLFSLAVLLGDAAADAIAGSPALDDPTSLRSFEIETVARFSLGAHEVLPGSIGSGNAQADQIRDLAATVDEIAQIDDPRLRSIEYVHRFRAIVVLAEFTGADDAIENIDALLAAPDPDPELLTDARLMRRVYEHDHDTLDPGDRDRLIDRHAWIGRLGARFGAPPDDADRAAVLADARVTFLGLMGLIALFLVALPVGFAFFVLGIVLAAGRRLRPRYRPDRRSPEPHHTSFLELVSLFMGGLALLKISSALLDRVDLDDLPLALLGLLLFSLQWALLLLVLWPLARAVRPRPLLHALGWHRGRSILAEMLSGVLGYVAGLPLLLVGFLMMFALIALFDLEPTHPIVERARDDDPLNLLLVFSIAVVWAPLVEETVFRGAFYHHLRRWRGPALSAIIVAFVFAGVHPQGIAAMPPLMALAIVFAMIREWRGSLIGPVTAHALHNAVLVTANFLFLA